MKVSLSSSKSSKDNNKSIKTASSISGHLSALRESSTNTIGNSLSNSIVPEVIISNQWEQDTINKYHDLFQFPLDTTVNDRTMILLVLAYQMNCIRCFCELKDGALAKVNNLNLNIWFRYSLTLLSSAFHTYLKSLAIFWIGASNYFL